MLGAGHRYAIRTESRRISKVERRGGGAEERSPPIAGAGIDGIVVEDSTDIGAAEEMDRSCKADGVSKGGSRAFFPPGRSDRSYSARLVL